MQTTFDTVILVRQQHRHRGAGAEPRRARRHQATIRGRDCGSGPVSRRARTAPPSGPAQHLGAFLGEDSSCGVGSACRCSNG